MRYIKLLFLVSLSLQVSGQSLITLLHQGQATFYPGDQLDSAYYYAAMGDTILLAGGEFVPMSGTLVIDKEVHIIGVGHRPDSTAMTGNTRIVGNVELQENADGGSFEGIYLVGEIRGRQNQEVSMYKISRCYILGIAYSFNFWFSPYQGRFVKSRIEECVFDDDFRCMYGNCEDLTFSKNIFNNEISLGGNASLFQGNVFHARVSGSSYFTFKNNVFLGTTNYTVGTSYRMVLLNNLFLGPKTVVGDTVNNILINNIFNQPLSSIYANFSGNYFDYSHDYHILPGSPGYTLSTDGGPVGIYGGQIPAKPSSRPATPSILTKQVGIRTDSLGRLPIRIRVKAEDY